MTAPHLYLEPTRTDQLSILPFLLEGKPSSLQQKRAKCGPHSCRRPQDAQSAVWQCSVQLAIIMCCIGSPWLLFVATSEVVARSSRLTAYVRFIEPREIGII